MILRNFTATLKKLILYFSIVFYIWDGGARAGQLIITNPATKSKQPIRVVTIGKVAYFALNDFATALGIRTFYRPETGKLVLFFPKAMLKFTANASFCMIDTRVFQLTSAVIIVDESLFAPLNSTLTLVRDQLLPGLQYRIVTGEVIYQLSQREDSELPAPYAPTSPKPEVIATVSAIQYEERQNGLTIKISANKTFSNQDLSYFFKEDNWFYLTIYGATCDSAKLSRSKPTPSIELIEAIPLAKSVQLSLKLSRKFERADVTYDAHSGNILVSLFLPLNYSTMKKIEEVKNSWIVDTIVLDPGHGGQDPGTLGRWGYLNEKDIVLDIALRVGKLLEKRKDLKVVYTRDQDEFIPLWKRTKIANDAAGKIFLSFHINAMPEANRGTAEGIELYLQNPSMRSQEAIEVAKLENAVIQLETSEDKAKYKDYDNPSHILANMVFQTYLHDSEKFAEILSKNISQRVPQKNRGVKQANLYVLVGASMPNLLCEFGYNDNRNDAKKLNDPDHRQKIAEAVYRSILEFKEYCDSTIHQ